MLHYTTSGFASKTNFPSGANVLRITIAKMASTELEFHTATPDDAVRIQQFVEAAFRAEDARPDWTADMGLGRVFKHPLEGVQAALAHPDENAIVLATDARTGALVGTVQVAPRADGAVGRIAFLSVDPGCQGAGLGRRVLAAGEDYCRTTWGASKMTLSALSPRHHLIAWYVRRGYRETGERVPFPKEWLGDLVVSEELFFVELEKDVGGGPAAVEASAAA